MKNLADAWGLSWRQVKRIIEEARQEAEAA
jgi:hypothetical protein